MDWLGLGKNVITASITAGVVSFVANQWVQLRQIRLAHLREQLEKFYGPMVFLTRTNSTILKHHQKLNTYGNENLGTTARINWADPYQVNENSAEIEVLMTLLNNYGDKFRGHNMQMVDIIRGNYHLIDAEDESVCQKQVLSVVRLDLESDGTHRLHDFKAQNPISIIDPEFVQTIEKSYEHKRAELKGLSAWPLSRAWKRLTAKRSSTP